MYYSSKEPNLQISDLWVSESFELLQIEFWWFSFFDTTWVGFWKIESKTRFSTLFDFFWPFEKITLLIFASHIQRSAKNQKIVPPPKKKNCARFSNWSRVRFLCKFSERLRLTPDSKLKRNRKNIKKISFTDDTKSQFVEQLPLSKKQKANCSN